MSETAPATLATDALSAALEYAARGWPVSIVERGGKAPIGRLMPHGHLSASKDPDVIAGWFTECPNDNVAIATGEISGLFALDADAKAGGLATLAQLAEEHGPLPKTPTVHTGGGGLHLYFRWPAGVRVKNGPLAGLPGLEVKGNGSGVVASPSVHKSGVRYAWNPELGPDIPLAEVPPWLLERLQANGGTRAPATGDSIAEGERNATLASLAGTMRRCGMCEGAMFAALLAENAARCSPPLPEREVRRIAHSVGGYPPALTATVEEPPHLTDTGNAERFRRLHGDNARWCDALGGWQLWTGNRWRSDTGSLVLEMAKATALTIYGEAAGARTEEERKTIAKWAMASESQARLDAMLYLARSLLPAESGDFDADPWLLNVNNGTIELHRGDICEPHRSDMITMLAPVTYDAEAHDDVFDRFLNDVTGGDAELAAYLQRAIGYSLTGDTREEVLFLLLGPTATGKSTLLESVAEMLGDYALKLPIDTFLQRRDFGAARPDIARLRGARFVIALEAGKGRHLDEPAVKEIVGGDSISARFLYHDLITFRPVCKLWLGSNFPPEMNNLDSAIWRRVRRIPFERGFGDNLDPTIKLHLRHNPRARSAILAWAVRGLLDWQQDGLGHAAIVDAKTSELRAEMNPIREFVDAVCVLGRGYVADAKGLRTAYETWAKDSGARPIVNKDWGEQLRDLGCDSQRLADSDGKKRSMWYGIGILAEGEVEI